MKEIIPRNPWLFIVGCCIACAASSAALLLLVIPVLMPAITAEMRWSRTQFSLAIALLQIGVMFGSPVVGYIVDKVGPRPVLLFSFLILPVVSSTLVFIDNYTMFLAWCIAFAFIISAGTPTALFALMTQWIKNGLGLSIGIALVATMLSAAIAINLSQYISSIHGWRWAWICMSGLMLFVGLPNAYFLLHDHPSKVKATKKPGGLPDDSTYRVTIRSLEFWMMLIGFALIAIAVAGVQFHATAFAIDSGAAPQRAATAAAMVPLGSIAGRLVSGFLVDRKISYWVVAIGMFSLLFAACLLLLQATGIGLLLAFLLVGVTFGAEADLLPFAIRAKYGIASFGKLYGLGFGAIAIGPMCGPAIMAFIHDRSGSYSAGFMLFAAAIPVATFLMYLSRGKPIKSAQAGG